ncbi:MAG: superoxide dismutase family protein [Alphaproteobacteria bacterium]|nr:MAG: superoxide dismutase family protein [Alphaproteobacteria bacterium]
MKRLWIGGIAALALAGCTASEERVEAPAVPVGPAAELLDASGQVKARASITAAPDALRIHIEALGLAPGAYGTHIHTTGRCDPPDFASAGGHWNPSGAKHGKDNPQGPHNGDLPNLLVGADGRGNFDYLIPGASLAALMDADGASVMIHAAADDYRTDPSGNSGARIACGVLR